VAGAGLTQRGIAVLIQRAAAVAAADPPNQPFQ